MASSVISRNQKEKIMVDLIFEPLTLNVEHLLICRVLRTNS
jgi:hypothetical protein